MNNINVPKVLEYVTKIKIQSLDNNKSIEDNTSLLILILNEIKGDDKASKQALINLLMDTNYRFNYLLALKEVLLNCNDSSFETLKMVVNRYASDHDLDLNKWFIHTVFLGCFYLNRDFIVEEEFFNRLIVDSDYIDYTNYKIISQKLSNLKIQRVSTMNLDNLSFYNYLMSESNE